MRVILMREVKSLGRQDDVVNVAEGYARNYLFPRKLAVLANQANLAELGKRQKAEEARGEKTFEAAKDVVQQLSDTQITIEGKVGAGTKLYGSITPADIAEALEKQAQIAIDKRKIELEEPIKSLGTYDVPIRLHRDAVAHVKLEVIGEGSKEAEAQAPAKTEEAAEAQVVAPAPEAAETQEAAEAEEVAEVQEVAEVEAAVEAQEVAEAQEVGEVVEPSEASEAEETP